jgi:DNA-binding NarL/FixJ family response regulator
MADPALLDEVRQSAEAALGAQATGEESDETTARKLAAARAALDGGHSIAAIAAADTEGERAARERVGGQVLRLVERSAKKMRESTEEYERAIVQATRLGLPARDIAARAGISHGTVAAVARRHEQADATPPEGAAQEASDVVDAGEAAPEPGAA